MRPHPTTDELSGFLLGKLAPEDTDLVAGHIDDCEPCQATLHSLEAHNDTLLVGLRGPAPAPVAPDAQRVVEKIAKIPPAAAKARDGQSAVSMSGIPGSAANNATSGGAAVSREQFIAALSTIGIIEPDEWAALEAAVPAIAKATDETALAKALIAHGTVTKFQAVHILQGKAKSLVLGEYLVLDKLGAGGMGQVLKARHRRMKRLVAVKILPASLLKTPDAVKRFQREVEAAARLVHPNIVIAHDAGQSGNVHFLVMEYVAGSDLSARLKKDGPLPVPQVIDYIRQAACGLAFAHAQGVVHRDIKPANLLVDAQGVVKVLDMGLARLDGDAASRDAGDGLTQSGQVMGTVDYMAPEQAFDTRRADARADMYSLGCTLHRLLVGQNMFEGETLVQKLLAHREKPIPSLSAARGDVPAALDALYQRMVAKNPDDRPNMTEVVEILGALAKSPAASPQRGQKPLRPVSVAGKKRSAKAAPASQPPKWRNPRVLAAAGAGGFLLLMFGIWIIIRDPSGREIARVEAPAGATVEVKNSDDAPRSPANPTAATNDKSEPSGNKATTGESKVASRVVPRPATESNDSAAQSPSPAPAVKVNATLNDPAFQAWMKNVSALPADRQVEAVVKKLQELNPGFDGKVTSKIENGAVTELTLVTYHVSDISPVRALVGLKQLLCSGSGSTIGKLHDLSPLQGMTLWNLYCFGNQVSDLSPLVGMPLKSLNIGSTKVADLSPLRQMKLTYLACDGTAVADLSPRQGMPLNSIYCNRTRVSDLSPLRGMPLSSLNCSDSSVADLSPMIDCKTLKLVQATATKVSAASVAALQTALPNCKIEWNNSAAPATSQPTASAMPQPAPSGASSTALSDPAFQAWMKNVAALPAEQQVEAVAKKLMELNPSFDGKVTPKIAAGVVIELKILTDNVTDISPVRVFSGLKILNCAGSGSNKGLSDLSPLNGMSLTNIQFGYTNISDISPLKGMPLEILGCASANISDLSPLAGAPLKVMDINGTKVSDLSPLKDMNLNFLDCTRTPVSDLKPLQGIPLTTLYCTATQVTDLSPLKGMPLEKLGCGNTQVSDLSPLESCKSLKYVIVKNTRVTPAGIEALKLALPDCKIE